MSTTSTLHHTTETVARTVATHDMTPLPVAAAAATVATVLHIRVWHIHRQAKKATS
jgi:hypothetical protein